MFSDYGKELLRSGIIEAKAGHKGAALRYLDRAVYMSHDHNVLAEAWFWMSQLIEDKAEKRKALENCLAHDLQHARARRALPYVRAEDLILAPDCGMKYLPREVAEGKLKSMVAGAAILRAEMARGTGPVRVQSNS